MSKKLNEDIKAAYKTFWEKLESEYPDLKISDQDKKTAILVGGIENFIAKKIEEKKPMKTFRFTMDIEAKSMHQARQIARSELSLRSVFDDNSLVEITT